MKILLLTAYYEPEQISSSHLTKDLEEAFVSQGCSLEIYTPAPTRGVSEPVKKAYQKMKYQEKYDGKIKIHRFAMLGEGRNPVLRFVRYMLCNAVQYLKGVSAKDADVMFAASTPPTQGLLCSLVKKRRNIPFVYNLQDIFPDSLIHSQLARSGSLLHKIGSKIEAYTYKNADKIIVISEDFKRNLLDKGVPEEKIAVVYNWVDDEAVVPVERDENPLFDELGFSRDKFYVVYAGNFGTAQGLDVLFRTAKLLEPYPDIHLVLFGQGALENQYKAELGQQGTGNISIFPLQPMEKVSQVYSLGDVSVVSCKPGFGQSAFPSKTWSILAAGTPVVASFDTGTELQSMIEENQLGVFTEAGNENQLFEAIMECYRDRQTCRMYGHNGREFVCRHMGKKAATQKYIAAIESAVSMHGRPQIT